MGVLSTGAGSKLLGHLFEYTGMTFQRKCFEYLSYFIPDLRESLDKKTADRQGIDIYKISAIAKYDFEIAFQCKGFESRFEKSQYEQCLHSISAVKRSKQRICNYYLIINLKSKYFNLDLRKNLEQELNQLQKIGAIHKAYLLDLGEFIEYLGDLMSIQIKQQVKNSNKEFLDTYRKSLRQRNYLEDVPFSTSSDETNNPYRFIKNQIYASHSAPSAEKQKSVRKLWFFVISEFGYGKSSLLMNILKELKRDSFQFIYIPASLLSKREFMYGSDFAYKLLEVITREDIDYSNPLNKLKAKVLAQSLEREDSKVVLMIDGLDEQDILFDGNLLKIFFSNITNYKCKVIFTLRKEMWDERYGNFQTALGKSRPAGKIKIFLEEWTNETIISYIDLIHTKNTKIKAFRDLVAENNYEKFYGDIPRRPLFLKMILSDVRKHAVQKQNISDLYFSYIREKIITDRLGWLNSVAPQRPLAIKEDIDKTINLIFTGLCKIANKMIVAVDKNNLVHMATTIDEVKVAEIISELGISSISELLLNSVIVSTGIRLGGNLQLRFAHKSFQEYFVARVIFLHIKSYLPYNELIPDLNFVHQNGVNQFLISIVSSEFEPQDYIRLKDNINSFYRDLPTNSIGDILVRS